MVPKVGVPMRHIFSFTGAFICCLLLAVPAMARSQTPTTSKTKTTVAPTTTKVIKSNKTPWIQNSPGVKDAIKNSSNIGHAACPLWVKSRHVQCNWGCPLRANSGHRGIHSITPLRACARTAKWHTRSETLPLTGRKAITNIVL
jgi:hypothetical protein